MPLLRQFFTNFSAGELTPRLLGRVDLSVYRNGAAQLRNFRQLAQGGVKRRPGTVRAASLSAISEAQLAEFIFNDDESYIFVFSNARVDIFDRDGTLSQSSTSQAWTTAMIGELSIIQVGDFMFVAHKDLRTKVIQRTAVDTFSISNFTFDTDAADEDTFQPYYKFEAASMTLDVSAYSGSSVDLDLSSPGAFTSDHVGAIFRYAGSEIVITSVTDAQNAVGDIRKRLPPTQELTMTAGEEANFQVGQFVTGEDTGVAKGEGIVVATSSGQVDVVVTGDHDGFNGIDTLIGPTGTTNTVTAVADASAPAATTEWDEQVFSDERGYARCVHVHDQRLLFGGSLSLPNHFFASVTGEFFNFDIGQGDDADAIQAVIFDRSVVEITGMASLRELQIFTAQQELYVDTGTKGTLTPDPGQLSFKKQTRYGSAKIAPQEFDGATLFVTRSKANIREFLFDDLENAFRANSVSFLAAEIISNPVDMAVQMEDTDQAEQYAYVINDDGTVAVFMSIRNENISAWSLWDTRDGTDEFIAAQSVSGRTFVVVNRNLDGSDELSLEYFDNTYSLDCATKDTNGTPTASWGPYAYLANETVNVRSGNLHIGEFTADASGNLDLGDNEVTSIEVGFNYTPTLKTLPPEFQLEDGISVGEPRRVVRVVLDLVSTLGVSVAGQMLLIRQVTDDLSIDPSPITARKEFYILGWDNLGQVTITQEDPLDLIINGVLVEVEIG